MRPLVLYHANCPDGFCAAWIAHLTFGDQADYVPVQYGQEPPEAANDRDRPLFILDFSYPRDVIFRLAAMRHAEMVVLDHHKTAEAALKDIEIDLVANNCGDALTVRFDMEKSGGRLTWVHFNPDKGVPWLVQYTEDRDLWRFALADSRAINAALSSYSRDFDAWNALSLIGPRSLVPEGEAIERYKDGLIREICRGAREITLSGHKILAANTSTLFSEVAGELAKDRPFGAAWFIRSDGICQWSLRSRDGGIDVSEIAKAYGGGGHRNAAGFQSEGCP
jgi:oligoribonuclease NrnB/cAMP/cGMP phosphodiesterase (DHH superfamily)